MNFSPFCQVYALTLTTWLLNTYIIIFVSSILKDFKKFELKKKYQSSNLLQLHHQTSYDWSYIELWWNVKGERWRMTCDRLQVKGTYDMWHLTSNTWYMTLTGILFRIGASLRTSQDWVSPLCGNFYNVCKASKNVHKLIVTWSPPVPPTILYQYSKALLLPVIVHLKSHLAFPHWYNWHW